MAEDGEEIGEVSIDQFKTAVAIITQPAPEEEQKNLAEAYIKKWNTQPTSIEQACELISGSPNIRERFFASECLKIWVRENISQLENVDSIFELLVTQIKENGDNLQREDIRSYMIIIADIVCISPNYFAVIENFELNTQISFLSTVIEEHCLPFVGCNDFERKIKETLYSEETIAHIVEIVSSAPVSAEWYLLSSSAYKIYYNDDMITAFLARAEEIGANLYYPGVCSFLENVFIENDECCNDELLAALMRFAIQLSNPELPNVEQYGLHIIYIITSYSDRFFSNNGEFTTEIMPQIFELFVHYSDGSEDFKHAFNNLCNLVRTITDSNFEQFGALRYTFIDLLIDLLNEKQDLISDELEASLIALQTINDAEKRNELIDFYGERIGEPTFGLLYLASCVQDWNADEKDTLSQLLHNIIELDEIPSTALYLIKKSVKYVCKSSEDVQVYLNTALSFFAEMPEITLKFLYSFIALNFDLVTPFLEELVNFFVPQFDDIPLEIKKYLYMSFFRLANEYKEDAADLLNSLGSDLIASVTATFEGEKPDIVSALSVLGSIISGSNAGDKTSPTELEFFHVLANTILESLAPLLQSEDGDIHSEVLKVFHQLACNKWVAPDDVVPLVEQSMSVINVPDQMIVYGDIFPAGFSEQLVGFLHELDVNGDTSFINAEINYITKVASLSSDNGIAFWDVFPGEFLVSLLGCQDRMVLESILALFDALIKSEQTPQEAALALISAIVSAITSTLSISKDLQNKAISIIFSLKTNMAPVIEMLTPVFGETEYSAALAEELQQTSPNKQKIIKLFNNMVNLTHAQ